MGRSSLIKVRLVDPRAAVADGLAQGKFRVILCGERRGPCRVLLIAKPRGGSACTRKETS